MSQAPIRICRVDCRMLSSAFASPRGIISAPLYGQPPSHRTADHHEPHKSALSGVWPWLNQEPDTEEECTGCFRRYGQPAGFSVFAASPSTHVLNIRLSSVVLPMLELYSWWKWRHILAPVTLFLIPSCHRFLVWPIRLEAGSHPGYAI